MADPSQHYNYGLALIDGQFWEEAIAEFTAAAELGYEIRKCREYCGDCAFHLGRLEEAIRFYNMLYADAGLDEELKRQILLKITKCSQTRKKLESESVILARSGKAAAEKTLLHTESLTSCISSLDRYSLESVFGRTILSWAGEKGGRISNSEYIITNLLHVGSSSLIVEMEELDSGQLFAGQILTGRFGEILSPTMLYDWVRAQRSIDSRHLVRIRDLAESDRHFFIVREHFPLSLNDILTTGETIPIPIAIRFAYHVLEALGDLHLHRGVDGTVMSSFHLDLRPSRILLRTDAPCAKVCNGGLWRGIERAAPEEASIRNTPLHALSYRAPEQFRPYLSRKRPPLFTDIYLFGVLFYEMLTGIPAFKASSFEEYEIQHCEQYPSPPRVWRAEIPDTLNDMIMHCLETDPMKRFRSTTQMSLLLEKTFPGALARPKDDTYQQFLKKIKLL